jgi:hypothetical protein
MASNNGKPKSSQLSQCQLLWILYIAITLCIPWNAAAAQSSVAATTDTVLHSFGGIDGDAPEFGLIPGPNGSYFGGTLFGGPHDYGAVFQLTPKGSGYDEKVIYGLDGTNGFGVWGIVRDAQGNIFGATLEGGTSDNCYGGCGTAFELTPGARGYTFTLLHMFEAGLNDVGQINAPMVMDKQGNLYGVGQNGGPDDLGGIFKLTRGSSGYTESVIYFFDASGVIGSSTGLTIDKQGTLYGVGGGGTGNCFGTPCGVVFKLTQTDSGYTETTLYNFQGPRDANDPTGPLTVDDSTGVIYGTSQYGGKGNNGTVFRLTPTSSGYRESFLYSFQGGGFGPEASLTLAPHGVLYGTTALGGRGCAGIGCGTVFKLTPSGSGYSFKYIYEFDPPSTGADPEHNQMILDSDGRLLGATRSGGSKTRCYNGGPGGALGCGVIFRISP